MIIICNTSKSLTFWSLEVLFRVTASALKGYTPATRCQLHPTQKSQWYYAWLRSTYELLESFLLLGILVQLIWVWMTYGCETFVSATPHPGRLFMPCLVAFNLKSLENRESYLNHGVDGCIIALKDPDVSHLTYLLDFVGTVVVKEKYHIGCSRSYSVASRMRRTLIKKFQNHLHQSNVEDDKSTTRSRTNDEMPIATTVCLGHYSPCDSIVAHQRLV